MEQKHGALDTELAMICSRGWAAAIGDGEAGINALAVPVWDATGQLVAAESVTAPDFRMLSELFEEFLWHLFDAARNLETRLH